MIRETYTKEAACKWVAEDFSDTMLPPMDNPPKSLTIEPTYLSGQNDCVATIIEGFC